ncbi:MAG TPA: N-acyl homoserine lactonase family protein [Thermoanaerobacterales bacterium]|nr:N-acyl homoserine lactonase family protein [Thermoanaerobacterales bacterium]
MVLGTLEADKSGFTYMAFPGTPIKLEVAGFLIEGAPKKILVDTGSWADLMKKYWPGKGVDFQTLEEALGKEGLTFDDIEIIIQTHLHHDHCGYTSQFKNADVYVQEEEWIFSKAPHPLQAQYYPPELFEGWKVRLIRGDYEIYPGISILHTPGHTPGTQSVAVNTKEGKAVIPGFCCTFDTFEEPAKVLPEGHPFAHWEVFSPSIATDLNQAYNSTLRMKTIADVLLPCHGNGLDGLRIE